MKRTIMALIASLCVAGFLGLAGCTQMPTEKQGISDMRPQISFQAPDERVRNARVTIDGLDMGVVGNYIEGTSALRILPGTHLITVDLGGQVILHEKFYVGDGVSRSFVAK
ncbi:hypothetical protein [Polaromonas sp.]|jgi:hypothetical protein|uniref:hypothetical protein n=1 Tax=Polaromonas sp. TaxID=1869339 RepID=UPI00356370BA